MPQDFAKSILSDHSELLKHSSKHWSQVGQGMSLELFQRVARRVPAYKQFLKEHGIRPASIKTYQDFSRLPIMNKDNYLRRYSLDELSWDGSVARTANSITSSSGSTGEPTFWPLNDEAEAVGRWYYELAHALQFQAHNRTTLAVVCYTLGTWMAGTYTLKCLLDLSRQGYPITVVSPGINKVEALKSIRNLAPSFDQVVLIGYPPFIKDLIDQGEQEGLDWKKLKIKMMFGGEGFNESWREYVLEKVGSSNPYMDTANVYAASDAAIMAIETPVSTLVRKLAVEDESVANGLFASQRRPSLQQFHPGLRNFEVQDGYLVVTAAGAIPLVRFNLQDQGGVLTFEEVAKHTGRSATKFNALLKPFGGHVYRLPFVYVFGRAHNTASIYAVNVYPENIRAGLEDPKVRHLVSGKFKMSTEYRSNMDQYLHIVIELAHDIKATEALEQKVGSSIMASIRRLNSEYNRLFEAVGHKAVPQLTFLPAGDLAFVPGAKLAKVAAK